MLLARKRHVLAATQSGGLTYQSKVIADGVSYYWRLDEPSGTTAVDSKGVANGTISGGVTLNQSGGISSGKSMLFDGITGKITTGLVVNIPVNFSFEAWIKCSTVGSFQSILSTRNAPANAGTFFGTTAGGDKLTVLDTSGHTFNGVRIVRNDAWHHIIFTCNGSTMISYVDGTVDTSVAFARVTPDINLIGVIGQDTPGSLPWNGLLDEIAIYPSVLTPTQISAHYALR